MSVINTHMYIYYECTLCTVISLATYNSFVGFFTEPSDVIASPGNKILLDCVIIDIESNALLDAQWYRNGILTEGLPRHQNFLDPGTNLTIGLEIFNVMATDSGAMYHCSPNGQPQISSRRASIIVAGTSRSLLEQA